MVPASDTAILPSLVRPEAWAKVCEMPKWCTRHRHHSHMDGIGAAAHSWPEPCEVSAHEEEHS